MAHHADERQLQRFARRLLVAAGDDEQVAQQPVKISVVKSAECHFVSCRHRAGQGRDSVGRGS